MEKVCVCVSCKYATFWLISRDGDRAQRNLWACGGCLFSALLLPNAHWSSSVLFLRLPWLLLFLRGCGQPLFRKGVCGRVFPTLERGAQPLGAHFFPAASGLASRQDHLHQWLLQHCSFPAAMQRVINVAAGLGQCCHPLGASLPTLSSHLTGSQWIITPCRCQTGCVCDTVSGFLLFGL